MTQFLAFTIFAPLASWGEVAVGEVRDSLDRPTRSAVLGCIAGALGIERNDALRQGEIEAGYGVAVHALLTGTPMRDYHTVQTVAASHVKRNRPRTRKQLLEQVGESDRETMLSRRTLRQDSIAMAVLWRRNLAPFALEAIGEALRRPHFVPYAGRKANAIGLPLDPELHESVSLAGACALACRRLDGRLATVALAQLRPAAGWSREVHHDATAGDGVQSGLERTRRLFRRDHVLDRTRWQFAVRQVHVGFLPTEERA